MSIASVIADQGTVALNLIIRDSLDKDALSFCSASGATDRLALSSFVRGVKALGLWNSMVCWPLRSSQNAGTGTTAYSLGGLGTFDGTLINGPVWNANAVDFTTNDSRMTTSISVAASPVAAMFVRQAQSDSGDNAAVFLTAGINVNGRQFGQFNAGTLGGSILIGQRDLWPPGTSAFTFGNFGGAQRLDRQYVAFRVLSASAARLTRNNTTNSSDIVVTGWDTSSPASVQFGYYPVTTADDTLSFMSYITAVIDNTTDAAFYTLYKQTLGTGLGLP
jgi:hypothetical protein